eukprot:PhF_6_TR8509/c0_g1_i1/m.13315
MAYSLTSLLFGVSILCVVTLATSVPSKPQWPIQFESPFILSQPIMNIYDKLCQFHYNWDIQSTRVNYPNGCIPEITNSSCDLIFNPKGTYLLLQQSCCLLFPGVGSVPPNFLAPFNFTNVTIAKDMYGHNHVVDYWVHPGDGFAYWTDKYTGNDIKFQDGNGILWNFGELVSKAQPASLFVLPSNCSAACPTAITNRVTPRHLGVFAQRN